MSLALFNAVHVEAIKVLFDEYNQPWFKRSHVGKFSNLPQIANLLQKLDKSEICTRADFGTTYSSTSDWSGPKDQQNKMDVFLSKKGVSYVINKCRKPSHNLCSIADFFGVELHKNKRLSKEQKSILNIMTAFEIKKMHIQYNFDQYKIDLYFSEHMLAVKCDEFDHQDRDIEYEFKRQKYIEDKLRCIFIRYNPEAKDFNLFKVINPILNTMCSI